MKALFVCLGTYKTKDTTGSDPDNYDRQLLYAIALTRLNKLLEKKDMGVLVVENSATSVAELHPPLRQALQLPCVVDVLLSRNNFLGTKNKGAGEYGMCRYAVEQKSQLFNQAEWVVYYTHRHVMAFPLVFGYLEKYGDCDAIVSGASYLFPDGSASPPSTGLFDDLIFAMKKDVFLDYVESMNPEILVQKRIGSEQNLYHFLTSSSIRYKKVERFGVLRYNYASFQMEIV
jgi:hypothetical protein